MEPSTSHEEITDNAFGRLKGEWDQLLANYPFDRVLGADNIVDASTTTANLSPQGTASNFKQVLSTAPVATEIPQIRSALLEWSPLIMVQYNRDHKSRNMGMYRKMRTALITEFSNAVTHLLMLLVHGTE